MHNNPLEPMPRWQVMAMFAAMVVGFFLAAPPVLHYIILWWSYWK